MTKAKHILVIDDQPSVCEVVELMFMDQPDCVVESAANGQEALEKLKDQDFDFIICDLDMPVMSGEQFIREFDPSNSETPMVLLSAKIPPGEDQYFKRLGVKEVFSKPFDDFLAFKSYVLTQMESAQSLP